MEGFATAFSETGDTPNDYSMVEVNFSGIPDGVTVMITHTATDQSPTGTRGALEDDAMKVTLTGEGDAPATGTMVEVTLDDATTMEMVISLTPFPMRVTWFRGIR